MPKLIYPIRNEIEEQYLNEIRRIATEKSETINIPVTWKTHLIKTDSRHSKQARVYFEAIHLMHSLIQDCCPIKKNDKNGQLKLYKPYGEHKLRRTHQQFARETGLTKTQVKEALDFLQEKGLVEIERVKSREIAGEMIGNLVYYSINLSKLEAIGKPGSIIESDTNAELKKPTLPLCQPEQPRFILRTIDELLPTESTYDEDFEFMPDLFSPSPVVVPNHATSEVEATDLITLKKYLVSQIPARLATYWDAYFHVVRIPPTSKKEIDQFITELDDVANLFSVDEYTEELLRRKRTGQPMISPTLNQ